MGYKYTLIISQYYDSRHSFIVENRGDSFIDQARLLAADLFKIKRSDPDNERHGRHGNMLGDIDTKYYNPESSRQNINDEGDIYFIHSNSIRKLLLDIDQYNEQSILDLSYRDKRTKRHKEIKEEVKKHHKYSDIAAAVYKHFNMVGDLTWKD